MVVGAGKPHLAQGRLEALGVAARVPRCLSTGAGKGRPGVVGRAGVEPLLDGTSRHRQRLATRGSFSGFKVQSASRAGRDQRFDLTDDLGLEGRFEPPFLAASSSEAALPASSWASDHNSQACQYASMSLRKRWPASTC